MDQFNEKYELMEEDFAFNEECERIDESLFVPELIATKVTGSVAAAVTGKVGIAGPIAIALSGPQTWFAIIALIVVGAVVGKYMGITPIQWIKGAFKNRAKLKQLVAVTKKLKNDKSYVALAKKYKNEKSEIKKVKIRQQLKTVLDSNLDNSERKDLDGILNAISKDAKVQ